MQPTPNWRTVLVPLFVFILACAIGGKTMSELLAPIVPLLIAVLLLALLGNKILRRR